MNPVDVIVTMVSDTYADSVRRGFYSTADQFVLSLLDSPQVGKVLVADHPRGVASQLKRRLKGDRPAPRSGHLRGVRPVTLTTPERPDATALARRYRAYDLQLRGAAVFKGLRNPVLVSFNHWHAAAARWGRRAVFYAQDDEVEIPRKHAFAPLSRSAYQAIDAGPMFSVAVTRALLDRVAPSSSGLVIPNGVDPDLWSSLPSRRPFDPGRPRAVYVGTVDRRVDVDGLVRLPRAGFALRVVGPVADPAVAAALRAAPGIELVGALSRAEVAGELRGADICVLAHEDTVLTQAMSPLKLFEYVASGTPVVATDLPGVREAGLPVEKYPVGGDLVAASHRALARGPLPEDVRRRLVQTMSWRTRHAGLIELLVDLSRDCGGTTTSGSAGV